MNVGTKLATSLSTKGQITIPVQVRRKLSLKEGDLVFFELMGENTVQLKPSRFSLDKAYGSVKPLKLNFSEQRRIAREERAQKK